MPWGLLANECLVITSYLRFWMVRWLGSFEHTLNVYLAWRSLLQKIEMTVSPCFHYQSLINLHTVLFNMVTFKDFQILLE